MSNRYQIEISDYGYWVKDTGKQRTRFVHASKEELADIADMYVPEPGESPLFDKIIRPGLGLARELGRPPKVYYRDAEGKIGIPPEPDMVPPDCQRYEITSLTEEDAIAKEMSAEMYQKWQDHGEFTEIMEGMLAETTGRTVGARRELVDALAAGAKGRKEAECIRIMLDDLDREESKNQRVNIEHMFHSREYDR
jgi:hypothetical protein